MKQKPASKESLFGRGWLFALIIVFAGIFPLTAQEQENPFRDLFNSETYQKRLHELIPRFEKAEEEAALGMPAAGKEVVRVVVGGQAEKAGVSVGDIFTKLDDQLLWGGVPWFRTEEVQKATFFRPGKGEYSFDVTSPELVGIREVPFYRPEIYYLRTRKKRSPEWDRDVAMGMILHEENPTLAETAWHQAVEKGYPQDEITKYFSTLFAFNRQRAHYSDMREFVETMADAEEVDPAFLPGLLTFLVATHSTDLIETLVRKNPAKIPWTIQEAKSLNEWWQADTRRKLDASALLTRSKLARKENVKWRLVSTSKEHQEKPYRPFAFPLRHVFEVGAGKYWSFNANSSIPLKNVHIRGVARARLTGRDPNWLNTFWVAIGNNGPGQYPKDVRYQPRGLRASARLAIFGFVFPNDASLPDLLVAGGMEPRWEIQRFPVDIPEIPQETVEENEDGLQSELLIEVEREGRAFSFDVIRLENQVAVFVNDYCYLYYPCDPEIDDVFISMFMSGVEVRFDEFDIWRLEDEVSALQK